MQTSLFSRTTGCFGIESLAKTDIRGESGPVGLWPPLWLLVFLCQKIVVTVLYSRLSFYFLFPVWQSFCLFICLSIFSNYWSMTSLLRTVCPCQSRQKYISCILDAAERSGSVHVLNPISLGKDIAVFVRMIDNDIFHYSGRVKTYIHLYVSAYKHSWYSTVGLRKTLKFKITFVLGVPKVLWEGGN